MAPCLSKFPSLCLEAIFSHVPLVDLFRSIGLVCSSWYKSRRTELIRRKRLVIVVDGELESLDENLIYNSHETALIRHVRREDGSPWFTLELLEQIKFDAVVVPDGTRTIPFTPSLMNMSNITHVFCSVPRFVFPQVIRLIDHFSNHLTDLKLSIVLCCECHNCNDDKTTDTEEELAHNLTNMFACLDRLHSLRHLKLCLPNFPEAIRPQLSFLSRLSTFSISVGRILNEVNWILPLLNQCGENMESIEFHNAIDLDDLLKVDRQLDPKFKVLNIFLSLGDEHEFETMRQFFTRFNSLTILGLIECFMPMAELAQRLSQFHQLVHLYLLMNINIDFEEAQSDEEEEPGEQAQREIVQVPSVRLLNLYFPTFSHLDSERLFIPEIFPNLQVLRFEHCIGGCQECAIPRDSSEPELADQLAQCARLARQPFRRCTNLHTIQIVDSYVANEPQMITVDEL